MNSLQAIVLIGGGSVRSDKVVKLLSALQSLLFFWCRKHITTGEEGIRKEAAQLLEQCKPLSVCALGRWYVGMYNYLPMLVALSSTHIFNV